MNITLECRVSNVIIIWEVNEIALDRPSQRALLNNMNIFQIGPPSIPSVLVVGDVENNASRVCCEAVVNGKFEESCTTLVLFGENISQH